MAEIDELIQIKKFADDKHRRDRYFDQLQRFLLQIPIFRNVYDRNGSNNFRTIVKHFSIKTYKFGQNIYQNAQQRTFNVILKGVVMLFTNYPYDKDSALEFESRELNQQTIQDVNPQQHFYKRVTKNEFFGEKYQLNARVRIYCARSVSLTHLVQIDLKTLYKCFHGYFLFKELESKIDMLRRVVAFKTLSTHKLEKILSTSTIKKVIRGTILYKEGEYPKYFIALLRGEVTLKKKMKIEQQDSSFNLSILPKYEALAFEQVIKNEPYQSTAVCTSEKATVLFLKRQIAKQMFDFQIDKYLGVYKEKEDWRKERADYIFETSKKIKSRSSLVPTEPTEKKYRFLRVKTEPDQPRQKYEFKFADQDKLTSDMDTSRKNLNKQLLRIKKNSMGQQKKNSVVFTNISNNYLGDQLFNKYVEKKYKSNYKIFKQYADSNPPQYNDNPQLEYSLVKPFYVKKSQAIKNTKRQLKASRRKLYSEFLNNSLAQ